MTATTVPAARHPGWVIHRDGDGTRAVKLGGLWVEVVSRKDFLADRWVYNPGEHVLAIGPTQIAGKTRLLVDLLGATRDDRLSRPPVLLVTKPRDPTLTAARDRLGYAMTAKWPPRRLPFRDEPPGYMFWPVHDRELRAADNNAKVADQFEAVMSDQFFAGNSITVADELFAWVALLRLGDVVDRHLTQGGGMGAGLWGGTQKPSGTQRGAMSGFTFNSQTHSFYARDPVRTNRHRLGDISGINTDVVEDATEMMPPFHFLYTHRNGPTYCVVGAS